MNCKMRLWDGKMARWRTSAAAWQLHWPGLLWRCSSLCTICRIDIFILFYSQRWQHCGYCTSLTHSHLGPIPSEYTISIKDSSQKNHLDMDHVMVNYSCHTPRCHTHHQLPHISGCSPLIRTESGIERSYRNKKVPFPKDFYLFTNNPAPHAARRPFAMKLHQ